MDFHDLKTDIVYDKDKGSWKLTIEAWGDRLVLDETIDLLGSPKEELKVRLCDICGGDCEE